MANPITDSAFNQLSQYASSPGNSAYSSKHAVPWFRTLVWTVIDYLVGLLNTGETDEVFYINQSSNEHHKAIITSAASRQHVSILLQLSALYSKSDSVFGFANGSSKVIQSKRN